MESVSPGGDPLPKWQHECQNGQENNPRTFRPDTNLKAVEIVNTVASAAVAVVQDKSARMIP
jgi:hypothetical protein